MGKLFKDMMEGLNSVEEYLRGEREGFTEHFPNKVLSNGKKVRASAAEASPSEE